MNLPIPTATLARLNPHLFGGRTDRTNLTATPGVVRESKLHEEIFDECRRRGWIALHGSMAERTCRTLGEPDFVILADGGRVLFVECKSRTGKLSPAQAALKHHAEKLGHTVHVVRSMEQFFAVVNGTDETQATNGGGA
ncbi:MAG TPA: VRR-NUC domain-containing protein [Verrucomicrobiota bacterium]|nr:VRR-NUC domain-containing protein [Verrucomicrobiota bacterium]